MTNPVRYFEEHTSWDGELKPAGWYFYDETWADIVGPYASEQEANEMLERYCKEYLNG